MSRENDDVSDPVVYSDAVVPEYDEDPSEFPDRDVAPDPGPGSEPADSPSPEPEPDDGASTIDDDPDETGPSTRILRPLDCRLIPGCALTAFYAFLPLPYPVAKLTLYTWIWFGETNAIRHVACCSRNFAFASRVWCTDCGLAV